MRLAEIEIRPILQTVQTRTYPRVQFVEDDEGCVGVLPHYVVALSVEIAQHGVVVDCQAGEEGGRVEEVKRRRVRLYG